MMNMDQYIYSHIVQSGVVKQKMACDPVLLNVIGEICQEMVGAFQKGNKVLIAGNGGSAADAQHMAGELVNRFYFERPGLPAMALTTDTSVISAIANDCGYENIFARQIQSCGVAGDMFIGISTSGNSPNLLKAFQECREKGLVTVGLTGEAGGNMETLCDYCIKIPSGETPRIQEGHILVIHVICAVIEKKIFGEGF